MEGIKMPETKGSRNNIIILISIINLVFTMSVFSFYIISMIRNDNKNIISIEEQSVSEIDNKNLIELDKVIVRLDCYNEVMEIINEELKYESSHHILALKLRLIQNIISETIHAGQLEKSLVVEQNNKLMEICYGQKK